MQMIVIIFYAELTGTYVNKAAEQIFSRIVIRR